MCRFHGQVFCALTELASVANVHLGTTRYIVILFLYSAIRFPFFQDGGQHFGDDCSTWMMIASSVANPLMMIATSAINTLVMSASSVGQHFDDDCIVGQRS